MQPYLTYYAQHFSPMATLLIYIAICLITTFLLTAIFCPAPTSADKTAPRTLHNIDFLKILLTYVVVMHHQYQSLRWENEGFYGVEGFFIISGFMLSYTFSAQKATTSFIKNKLSRFIPYIFLGSLLELFAEYNINIPSFLSGILMVNCTGIYLEHATYGPSWYLTILFWISLSYFYLLKSCKINICNIIIAVMTYLALSTTHNIPPVHQPLNIPNPDLPFFTNAFIRGLSTMGLGYFLTYTYAPQKNSNSKLTKWLLTLAEAALLIRFGMAFFIEKYFLPRYVVTFGFVGLVWSFINQKSYLSAALEKCNWRPLSKYMLAIFMTHWFICRLQANLNLWTEYQAITRIALCLAYSTLLGILAYHTVTWGYRFNTLLHKKH